MAITLDELRALLPLEIYPLTLYADILSMDVGELRLEVPAWDVHTDGITYKLLEQTADGKRRDWDRGNDGIWGTSMAGATGDRLNTRAADYGVTRNAGESDDAFRLRALGQLNGQSPSSWPGLEQAAMESVIGVRDVSFSNATNLQDVTMYAAKANAVLLTSSEISALQLWMRRPEYSGPGWELTVGTATRNSYTISATIHYNPYLNDEATLENNIRTAVYRYIDDHSKLNTPINRANVYDALVVPGVIDVDPLTSPAADIAAVASQIPICTKDTSGVSLTFMTVTTL